MKIGLLGVIVTVAGLIFFAISLAIIILGKRVGERGSGLQKITVGKYIEINTNSALTLVLITACFTLAPIFLHIWKPQIANYVDKNEISKDYLPIKDLSIIVYGAVVLEDGEWGDRVKIVSKRQYNDSVVSTDYESGQQGEFKIELEHAKPKESYTITWSKDGYLPQQLKFGFNEIPFPIRLTRKGGGS